MVVVVIATMVLVAAVLLVVQFLQAGSIGLICAAVVFAVASLCLPGLARLIRRRSADDLLFAPEPFLDLVGAPTPAAPAAPARIERHEHGHDSPVRVAPGRSTDSRPPEVVPAELVVRGQRQDPDVTSPVEPVAVIGEVPLVPVLRIDPPDFTAEPVFDAGPVVAAPLPPKPADGPDGPGAGSDAEPSTVGELADRSAQRETIVAVLTPYDGALTGTLGRGDQVDEDGAPPIAGVGLRAAPSPARRPASHAS